MGLGVATLGVGIALITVQVEIVRAIDCASKCYTSHLSTFFLNRAACHLQRCYGECKRLTKGYKVLRLKPYYFTIKLNIKTGKVPPAVEHITNVNVT